MKNKIKPIVSWVVILSLQFVSWTEAATTSPSPTQSDWPPVEWSTPAKPFHIAGNVYYVGTQGLAAYLLTSKDGAVLLDGTLETNAALIERNIESLGVSLKDVKIIISDHAHNDHVGAIAKIKADTNAKFIASAADRWALENGRPRGDTNYSGMHFPPIKVDQVVSDGEAIHLGSTTLTAHLTPGHTPGCTSWSTTATEGNRPLTVLFLCSITVAGNVLVGNRAYPTIADDYRATFKRLDAMKPDIVLTSHPDMSGVLEREARREAGEKDAFIDPNELARIVAAARSDFEKSLSAGKKKESPP